MVLFTLVLFFNIPITLTDWAPYAHSVFFEQSKNAHFVPSPYRVSDTSKEAVQCTHMSEKCMELVASAAAATTTTAPATATCTPLGGMAAQL